MTPADVQDQIDAFRERHPRTQGGVKLPTKDGHLGKMSPAEQYRAVQYRSTLTGDALEARRVEIQDQLRALVAREVSA